MVSVKDFFKNQGTFQIKRRSREAQLAHGLKGGSTAGVNTRARRAALQWNRKGLMSAVQRDRARSNEHSSQTHRRMEKKNPGPLSSPLAPSLSLFEAKPLPPNSSQIDFSLLHEFCCFQRSSSAKCQGSCYQRFVSFVSNVEILRCIYLGLLYNVCGRFFCRCCCEKCH